MAVPFNDETRATIAAQSAAFVRSESEPSAALKRAAVAIVIADDGRGQACVLLTLRAAMMRAHTGQWALPGGRRDDGETPRETALRELREELGLCLGDDAVMGLLDDYPTRSGYLITPVVLWAPESAAIMPNPDEVAEIHRIGLGLLAEADAFDFISIPESPRRVVRYRHGSGHIHAPTAALLYQFREMVAGRVTRVVELEQPVFAWR